VKEFLLNVVVRSVHCFFKEESFEVRATHGIADQADGDIVFMPA
jgi:hypothetical protein